MKRVFAPVILTAAFLFSSAAAPLGTGVPAAVHFIDHDKVTATLVKGGALINDPGLTVLANRRGPGAVEYHEHTNHIFFILEGNGTLITGGTMIDAKRTSPEQMTATSIENGEVHHLAKGDVITIPAKTPHWWKDIASGTIAYYAVNIESQ